MKVTHQSSRTIKLNPDEAENVRRALVRFCMTHPLDDIAFTDASKLAKALGAGDVPTMVTDLPLFSQRCLMERIDHGEKPRDEERPMVERLLERGWVRLTPIVDGLELTELGRSVLT